ncbi:hypothetical protein BSKO_00566 [Bryopsis sp. KO-2023]|nr:hypothetical protein BSKO_00566 [Bryopsis sp. KO-2023]
MLFLSQALPSNAHQFPKIQVRCSRQVHSGRSIRRQRRLTPSVPRFSRPSLSNDGERGTVRAKSAGSPDTSASIAEQNFLEKVWGFVKAQYLPLTLVAGLVFGLVFPGPGVALAETNASKYCTAAIFFISGMLLEKGEAAKAVSSWGSVLYGLVSILVLTPLLAPLILRIPLNPPELALGLAIFSLTPTTLSSGVALMQIVGGNAAMAILLTIASNFLGVFTVPFSLPFVLGKATSGKVALSSAQLLAQLIKTVLVPAAIGYTFRASIGGLNDWVKFNKKRMSVISSILLAAVPWMQISQAVQNKIDVGPVAIALATATGMAIHLFYLAFNTTMVKTLRLGGESQDLGIQRAVIMLSSQKTLLISVTVIAQLGGVLGGAVGLAMIPCVFSHLGQIVIDSMVVSNWLKSDKLKGT